MLAPFLNLYSVTVELFIGFPSVYGNPVKLPHSAIFRQHNAQIICVLLVYCVAVVISSTFSLSDELNHTSSSCLSSSPHDIIESFKISR